MTLLTLLSSRVLIFLTTNSSSCRSFFRFSQKASVKIISNTFKLALWLSLFLSFFLIQTLRGHPREDSQCISIISSKLGKMVSSSVGSRIASLSSGRENTVCSTLSMRTWACSVANSSVGKTEQSGGVLNIYDIMLNLGRNYVLNTTSSMLEEQVALLPYGFDPAFGLLSVTVSQFSPRLCRSTSALIGAEQKAVFLNTF